MTSDPTLTDDSGRLCIAMALYGDITYDSRVIREADTLAGVGHNVTVYCLSGVAPPTARFRLRVWAPDRSSVLPDGSSPYLRTVGGSKPARVAAQLRWVVGYARNLRAWGRRAVADAGPVDAWHAHDLTGLLAVGPLVRAPARLVYDSHEIFLETGSAARLPGPLRRVLTAIERRLTRRAYAMVTVNTGYAKVLGRRLGPRRTRIVRNCPPRRDGALAGGGRLRHAIHLPQDCRLALYHGMLARDRGIEQLAASLLSPGLETVHVAVLGFGDLRPALEQLVRQPRFGGRLHLIDAVPPDELIDWVADADVDVIPLQRTSLNHLWCTPNKLWESLAAGVPVVVSDFPGMRGLVLDDPASRLGAVCDPADPVSIATAIRSILDLPPDERAALRERCLRAARDRWNWESQAAVLTALYAELARRRPAARPG